MDLGQNQLNFLDLFTLDCWEDQVYYEGRVFPAGHFAAEILNDAGEIRDPVLDQISTILHLLHPVQEGMAGQDVLQALRQPLEEALSWVCSCPPFCYQENRMWWEIFERAMDDDLFVQEMQELPEHLPYTLFAFAEKLLRVLLAIYHFCVLIRAFERKYLRRLKQRGACDFAQAAYSCFEEDSRFTDLQEHMPFREIEEFFDFPQLISGFTYVQNPKDGNKRMFVNQVICQHLIDFYTFDLFNGMQHGHAPSRCRNCGRYFLTTTAHTPKYCDGMAPQNDTMTCRQYGAMMHQKERNQDHPVYQLFTTRTNTIRKHFQRGKITAKQRASALELAAEYRDEALMDNDYAENGYRADMELEHIYGELEKNR